MAEGHWHQVAENVGVVGRTKGGAVHAEGAEDVGVTIGFEGLVG